MPKGRSKFLKINTVSVLKGFLYVLLFALLLLVDGAFGINRSPELSVRLTVGMVFMGYLLRPYSRWVYIIVLQLVLTFLFNLRLPLEQNIVYTLSETSASLFSVFVFLLTNKSGINRIDGRNILEILGSSIVGVFLAGMLALLSFKMLIPVNYSFSLVTWVLSGISGIMLMAPVIALWRNFNRADVATLVYRSMLELILLVISVLVATHLIFNTKIADIYISISFPYLILPFIFWAAIRFHPRILSLLLFVVSMLILYYTVNGELIFRQSLTPGQRIVNSVQIFILFTIVFSYVMAGIIQVRREAAHKIKLLNEELEERVLIRTRELEYTMEALMQSEEQFREAFETSLHGMALISLRGRFLRVNQAFADMVGYPVKQLLKMDLQKITYHEDFASETKVFKKLAHNAIEYYQMEKRLLHKDDLMVWIHQSNSLIKKQTGEPLHIVSQIVDITERKQVEEQLRKYTETLTVLLREVNHRVKNNLSALIGILHMEEDRAVNQGNIGYIHLLREVNSRIRGLATVHSMLSAGNWQPLEISELSTQIIQAVLKGLPFDKEVSLKVDKSAIKIGSNQAHHLTLVINELATNSIKYGVTDNPYSSIEMNIEENDGRIHIVYRDNGPGFPEPIINGDYSKVGIGFELIRGIVTQSLDGDIVLRNDNGAVTEIFFANELS
jgi:PAS domain S-box